MSLGLDKLLDKVQEQSLIATQLAQKLSDATRRVANLEQKLEELNNIKQEVSAILERLKHGAKRFEKQDDTIAEKLDGGLCKERYEGITTSLETLGKKVEEKVDKRTVRVIVAIFSVLATMTGLVIAIYKVIQLMKG